VATRYHGRSKPPFFPRPSSPHASFQIPRGSLVRSLACGPLRERRRTLRLQETVQALPPELLSSANQHEGEKRNVGGRQKFFLKKCLIRLPKKFCPFAIFWHSYISQASSSPIFSARRLSPFQSPSSLPLLGVLRVEGVAAAAIVRTLRAEPSPLPSPAPLDQLQRLNAAASFQNEAWPAEPLLQHSLPLLLASLPPRDAAHAG
jgi:hypothetical protein